MHNSGLIQDDIHLKNFLQRDDDIWVIDAGSVQPGKAPLANGAARQNLSQFIAQFYLYERTLLYDAVKAYFTGRKWESLPFSDKELKHTVYSAWEERKDKHLKKRFRDCTEVHFKQTASRVLACHREYLSPAMEEFLAAPDSFIEQGEMLKAGNTATVAKVKVNERDLVVKRYNLKSIYHALKRSCRPSRAWKSWHNIHLFRLIGIPSQKPVAFIEERCCGLRGRAYFIVEFCPGREITDYYRERTPDTQELNQFRQFFQAMLTARINHGDLKGRNFLINDGKIFLIDLDAVSEHRSEAVFKHNFYRDLDRFMRNWQDHPAVEQAFQELLSEFSL